MCGGHPNPQPFSGRLPGQLGRLGTEGWDGNRIAKEAEEGTAPLSRFSRSPEPVLVEVSTKDGAHIGSKPGTAKETLETITLDC